MSDAYVRQRQINQNKSTTRIVGTADTTVSGLVTPRDANHTLYIQHIRVTVTSSSAGKTWTFKDSAGTPIVYTAAIPTDTAGETIYDFGPDGIPLTAGKNLDLIISAAGAAGTVVVSCYQRPTTPFAAG